MNNFVEIYNAVKKANNIGIFTHQNADGDAVGSALALQSILKRKGKTVGVWTDSENYPENLEFLKPDKMFNKAFSYKFDLVIALDCAEKERIGKFQILFNSCKNSINVDHHKGNTEFAKINVVDVTMSSTCELVCNILQSFDGEFENLLESEAKLLLSGIMTDTGRFKYSCVTPQTFDCSSGLLKIGKFNINTLTTPLFDEMSMTKFKVNQLAMKKAEFLADEKVGLIFLTYEELANIGADFTYAKDLSIFLLGVKSVQACAIVSEDAKHTFYVSYRSKGDLDISQCAKFFGGGGHKNASGCRLTGNKETVKEKIEKSLKDLF